MASDPHSAEMFEMPELPFALRATLDYPQSHIRLEWTHVRTNAPAAQLRIRCTGLNELTWELSGPAPEVRKSYITPLSINDEVRRYRKMFPVNGSRGISLGMVRLPLPGASCPAGTWEEVKLSARASRWNWLERNIQSMADALAGAFNPLAQPIQDLEFTDAGRLLRREARRAEKAEREAQERARHIQEALKRQAQAEAQAARARELMRRAPAPPPAAGPAGTAPAPRPPPPPVKVTVDLPPLEFQDTLLNLPDLKPYFLLERARRWWISNQSDDLLALPYCAIERLDYQLRTALRVIGPLRGRALLSDEVGLGKTIEAGLVLKEYLTRGMIKRFLVLTVPSLVDQWEEELSEKFHLACVTTNHAAFRTNPEGFWRESPAVIASLHTVKQPSHLAMARQVNWDLLVVDEAHYLRNRSSQAWQAVNALPRQFLLLLTATPVQNSLEELYNLVTLLQPGQLPAPKEFKRRFIDAKQPHRPREPEELRRVLSQIMIRNTRANAGIQLPPRRAETVLFEPQAEELAFWQSWEKEFRAQLTQLSSGQASLWGHLLLQTAGSSPAAWRQALLSFPAKPLAEQWREQAPLAPSWEKKCELVLPLTRAEGGVVIFTQFLQTQAALAEWLAAAKVRAWVVNGQTPAAQRQPITEQFRAQGGALLLTHSGTEGRNLQFCHRLINFDLPWNPMEIEQRIGRLHRLGQQQPVRIYNFVQKHTLQEHLLEVLQEKLNLFELVVGETELILGERFSGDDFAEEVFRRWRDAEGRLAEAMRALGEDLAAARQSYDQVKALDETLFAKDYEAL